VDRSRVSWWGENKRGGRLEKYSSKKEAAYSARKGAEKILTLYRKSRGDNVTISRIGNQSPGEVQVGGRPLGHQRIVGHYAGGHTESSRR